MAAEFYLRHFIPQYDAPLLSKWMLDSDYANFFRGQLMPPTFEDIINYPKWSGVMPFMMIKKAEKEGEEDQVAGMATISNFDLRVRSAHYSGIADKAFQGKHDLRGAVKATLDYCFKVMGFRKMITVFVEERFKPFYESMGFKHEGMQYKDSYLDGEWIDSQRMCIFAEDWR